MKTKAKPRVERRRNAALEARMLRFTAKCDVECEGCGGPIYRGEPCYAHRNRDFHAPSCAATYRDGLATRIRRERSR